MNESSEQRNSTEVTVEEVTVDIKDGLEVVTKLMQQLERGADVGDELERVKESIHQRLAKALEDLGKMAEKNEFGEMDKERFEQFSNGPAHLRQE